MAINKKLLPLVNPLSKDNPVIVQVLGICSALAVTAKLEPALVMTISVTAVLALSNVLISLLRKTIPTSIRIIVQLVVVAALVVIVDQVSKALSVFIGLIITNCIIMGRLEAFSMSNRPWPSFLDGIGNGLGYGIILVIVAFFRELLGSGTLMGYQVIPESWYAAGYSNNGMMILPPMALITVACIIWVHRSRNKDLQE